MTTFGQNKCKFRQLPQRLFRLSPESFKIMLLSVTTNSYLF